MLADLVPDYGVEVWEPIVDHDALICESCNRSQYKWNDSAETQQTWKDRFILEYKLCRTCFSAKQRFGLLGLY